MLTLYLDDFNERKVGITNLFFRFLLRLFKIKVEKPTVIIYLLSIPNELSIFATLSSYIFYPGGGIVSAVLKWLNENGNKTKVIRLGIPNRFIEHDIQQQLYKECGFDIDGIYQTAKQLIVPKMAKKAI